MKIFKKKKYILIDEPDRGGAPPDKNFLKDLALRAKKSQGPAIVIEAKIYDNKNI